MELELQDVVGGEIGGDGDVLHGDNGYGSPIAALLNLGGRGRKIG